MPLTAQQIDQLFKHVLKAGTYIPRDYKTIGGMWTTDTWVLDVQGRQLKAQLMDEGYTQCLVFDGSAAYSTNGNPPYFGNERGEEVILEAYSLVFPA